MTVWLSGAISMRQNDFGGASRASRIAARITAGCVTAARFATSRLSVDSSQPSHPVDQVDNRLAAVRGAGGFGQPHLRDSAGSMLVERLTTPAARNRDRPTAARLRLADPSNSAVWRARFSGPESGEYRRRAQMRRRLRPGGGRVSLSGSSAGNRPADIASVIACDTKVSRTTSVTPRYSMPVRSRFAPAAAPQASPNTSADGRPHHQLRTQRNQAGIRRDRRRGSRDR